jgi:Protein of unknown function (DUF3592)
MAARRRRRWGPRRLLTAAVIMYAMCAYFVVAAVAAHAAAARSSYVQAHGTRVNATVTSVRSTVTAYLVPTTQVTVRLQPPFDGTTISVVHVADEVKSHAGETISVLVDPSQPGYSELPGSRGVTTVGWLEPLAFVVSTLIVGVLLTAQSVRLFRVRQEREPAPRTLVEEDNQARNRSVSRFGRALRRLRPADRYVG